MTPKQVRLYADERKAETRDIIKYLFENGIQFTIISSDGYLPYAMIGAALYIGFEEIKKMVKIIKDNEKDTKDDL
jgi:hypothetical protein